MSSSSVKKNSTGVFHEGERAVQLRAGVTSMSDRVANGIHPTLPEAARAFLQEQRFAVIGGSDAQGRVWASPLWGAAGFLASPDPATVTIDALPAPGDPLYDTLTTAGTAAVPAVGLLVLDPATRRRMRVNGHAYFAKPDGLRIRVEQAYANCPKYIQKRRIEGPAETNLPGETHHTRVLLPEHRAQITRADTFFLATAHPERGADASHRGGAPGFVHISDDGSNLLWPDYAGNAMFNTLGNIAAHSSAGLLFVDWETGALLQITGKAHILWNGPDVDRFPGAERAVSLPIDEVISRERAFPLHYRFEEASPFNPH